MRKLRIIAIDDEEQLLSLVNRFLTQKGHEVHTCARAKEALSIIQLNPDQFDLAIADLAMPEMTGEVLLAKLLRTAPNLRILVCSGYPFDTGSLDPVDQERTGFLQKPFLPNMLLEAIETLTK
jgi:DNA-binding NtrC family response regulator